jgi:hypothetical protein
MTPCTVYYFASGIESAAVLLTILRDPRLKRCHEITMITPYLEAHEPGL